MLFAFLWVSVWYYESFPFHCHLLLSIWQAISLCNQTTVLNKPVFKEGGLCHHLLLLTITCKRPGHFVKILTITKFDLCIKCSIFHLPLMCCFIHGKPCWGCGCYWACWCLFQGHSKENKPKPQFEISVLKEALANKINNSCKLSYKPLSKWLTISMHIRTIICYVFLSWIPIRIRSAH